MKRIRILLPVLGAFLSSATLANSQVNQNHFYVGAQAGAAYMQAHLKPRDTNSIPRRGSFLGTTKTLEKEDWGITGELFSGYNFYFNDFMVSPELLVGFDNAKAKKTNIRLGNPTIGTVVDGLENELRREWYINAALRFGKKFGSDVLLYGKVGISGGRFKYKFKDLFSTGLFSENDRKWLLGFNPGAGVEYKICESMPLWVRAEYNFYTYEVFKSKKM